MVLPKIFKESIKALNLTADGREWLTDIQLEEIFFEIQNFAEKSLHEGNKEMHRFLLKNLSDGSCIFLDRINKRLNGY